jgi:DNA repair exonuclease SbcCD ATPase subunit
MYYEEQWVDGALCWRTSPTGAWTRYTANELAHRYESAEKRAADAQATVEALRAEKLMLERGVAAQSALIDGLQSQLIQRTADLEAVQHERDEANSHVKFLGATKQANGSFCLDMKKYHARHRCGRHRDDPWKGIDTEIDCFVCLKHALDAEREKVKDFEAAAGAMSCKEIADKVAGYTQLQALVRALLGTWVNGRKIHDGIPMTLRQQIDATLDATTPAGGGQE